MTDECGNSPVITPVSGSESAATLPRSVLDAGGDIDVHLTASLYRQIDKLEPGQLLEVISRNPKSRMEVVSWCALTHNELVAISVDASETVYLIRRTA